MNLRIATIAITLLALVPDLAPSWGDDGHHLILENALRALPPEIRKAYDGKWRDLKKYSVEPDRRSSPVAEGSRHYLDIEKLDPSYLEAMRGELARLGGAGYADEDARDLLGGLDAAYFAKAPPPWDGSRVAPLWNGLPPDITSYRSAVGREEIFVGSVVYQPYLLCRALARAVEGGDRRRILLSTGYLAHYVGDISMPLHLTANYKGQFSGNASFSDRERGDVHSRFETGFIKARRETIAGILKGRDARSHRMEYADITPRAARIAADSYALAAPLLDADLKACASSDPRRDWEGYIDKASPAFLPMARTRMESSVSLLADLILTAWTGRSTRQTPGM